MKKFRNSVLMFVSLILLSGGASGLACGQSKKGKAANGKNTGATAKPAGKTPSPAPPWGEKTAQGDFKVLLQGNYSKVETPFVFVARDPETYALMRSMVEGLPASSTVDFTKTAVVAAFAGERNTGGWTVSVRNQPGNRILVDLREPRKGQMTTQVISTPFQIVLVPALEMQPLPPIEMTPTWTRKVQTYRVSKGDFEFSGGIRGMTKKFTFDGTVDVLTFGDKVTYNFKLSGKGSDGQLKLSEMASGALGSGQVGIAHLEPGSFVEMPHPPVKVTGTANDQKLSLNFESLPARIADGFMGRGKLEAVKIK